MLHKINLSLNQIVSSCLFLGYHVSAWNINNNYFLLGYYKKTNIFNINCIYSSVKKLNFVICDILSKKGTLWLINEKFDLFNNCQEFEQMKRSFAGAVFFNDKWCKGVLTNYKHIKLIKPGKFPHAMVFPNTPNNASVINESFIINVPSFGLSDTVDNPNNIFFNIPGNSRNIRSVFYFYSTIARCIFSSKVEITSSFLFNSLRKIRSIQKKNFSADHSGVLLSRLLSNFNDINPIKNFIVFLKINAISKKLLLKQKLIFNMFISSVKFLFIRRGRLVNNINMVLLN